MSKVNLDFANQKLLELQSNRKEKNTSESTEAEISDEQDTVSSLGDFEDVILRSKNQKTRSSASVINRLKANIAVLENRLQISEANDKIILLGRLKECRIDHENLKNRNVQLKLYINELETSLFSVLSLWRQVVTSNTAVKPQNSFADSSIIYPQTPEQSYSHSLSSSFINSSPDAKKLNEFLSKYEQKHDRRSIEVLLYNLLTSISTPLLYRISKISY